MDRQPDINDSSPVGTVAFNLEDLLQQDRALLERPVSSLFGMDLAIYVHWFYFDTGIWWCFNEKCRREWATFGDLTLLNQEILDMRLVIDRAALLGIFCLKAKYGHVLFRVDRGQVLVSGHRNDLQQQLDWFVGAWDEKLHPSGYDQLCVQLCRDAGDRLGWIVPRMQRAREAIETEERRNHDWEAALGKLHHLGGRWTADHYPLDCPECGAPAIRSRGAAVCVQGHWTLESQTPPF